MTKPKRRTPIALHTNDLTTVSQTELDAPLTHAERQKKYRTNHADYVQRKQQSWSDTRASSRKRKPFVSVDGEGAPGRGDRFYVLLRAGRYTLTEPGHSGMRWDDCLDWLCHLPPENEYVSFSFDYDVTTILCGYSAYDRGWRTLKRLTEQSIDKPVLFHNDVKGWYVWYRPKMEFKVSPVRRCTRSVGWCSTTTSCKDCKQPADPSRGHMTRISDTIKLFQSTLVKVISDWRPGTENERDAIKVGKDKRELVSFIDPAERAEVTEYNRLETKLHADVMEQFRDAWITAEHAPHGNCSGKGLPQPRNWQTPGSLAKILYNHYRVPKRAEVDALGNVPDELWDYASLAMYGGWFEVSMFGPVPGKIGPIYIPSTSSLVPNFTPMIAEYDLTSAYPWGMTHLPCLRHSHWEHRPPRDGEYALQCVDASYTGPVRRYIPKEDLLNQDVTLTPDFLHDDAFPIFMGLPHRDEHGRVTRPLNIRHSWYWNFEIEQAKHQLIDVQDSWTWVSDGCGCNMWEFIPELFALRQRLGKLRGKPVKLAINSLYGVMAERKRGDSEPPYANLIVASFITAWTRTKIMRTIHENSCEKGLRCGSNVVMIATDAVFFVGDPKLPGAWDDGEKEHALLGDWTYELFPKGLFIVQGGIYWPPNATEAHSKTRGVPVSILHEHIQDFQDAYRRMMRSYDMNDGVVKLRYRRGPKGERVEAKRFVGLREAIHRNARQDLGRFITFSRNLGFDWTSKRVPWRSHSPNEPLWTLPKTVPNPVSQPYLPVGLYGQYVPEFMDEQSKLDMMNDSPEWLPIIRSSTEDDYYDSTLADAYTWAPDE